jgi:hypothetical protein
MSGCGGTRSTGTSTPGAGSGSAFPPPTATDCVQFAVRVVTALTAGRSDSKQMTDAERTETTDYLRANCEQALTANDPDASTAIGCAIHAKDDAAVAACLAPAAKAYKHRTQQAEAALTLNKLANGAKAYYADHAAFPTGSGAEPAQACCMFPDLSCPASTPAAGTVWEQLAFVRDEPSPFQFRYDATSQTGTATATADLDCDGHPVVFTLHLGTQDGKPTSSIDTPPEK